MQRKPIQEWTGRIIGWLQVESNGDKTLTDFQGSILGYYHVNNDYTTDFYGRIIGWGDQLMTLLQRD